MDAATHDWWTLLRGVAAANVFGWFALLAWWRRLPPDHRAARRALLWLAGGYTLGCAWRSWFPVFDVPRLVLVDSPLSSVLIGRTVATLAELCFAAQWALLLGEAGRAAGQATVQRLARGLLPLIVVAEVCSWTSVLTTSNLGHTFEESLWGVGALLIAAGFAAVLPATPRPRRSWLVACAVAAALYAAYLFAVDVPMYATRWFADQSAGRAFLGLWDGVLDAATRRQFEPRWAVWRGEVPWMTLYFSVGVWFSLAVVRLPAARAAARPAQRRPRLKAA